MSAGLRRRPLANRRFPAYWNHPLLTAAEERALLLRAKDESATQEERLAARNELVLKNQRLVVSIAAHRITPFLSIEALVSAGNLGLMRAVDNFDLRFGIRFSTYASKWILQFIQVETLDHGFLIRTPMWLRSVVMKYHRLRQELGLREGSPPTFDRVCVEMGLRPKQSRCLDAVLQLCDAEFQSHPDFDLDNNGELVDDRDDDTEVAVHRRETVAALLAALSPREAYVVCLKHGLDGGEPLTFREIAEREGKSKQNVHHVYVRAKKKLLAAAERMTSDAGGLGRRQPKKEGAAR